MKKSLFYCLNDLPFLTKSIGLISFHGLGKGGGEKVLQKISEIYEQCFSKSYQSISSATSFKMRILAVKKSNNFLLTAGLRDIDLIVLSIFLNKKFSVYIQVPYHKSISLKTDFTHFILVKIYMIIVQKYAEKIFVNASLTVPFSSLKKTVLLPILSSEMVQNKIEFTRIVKQKIIIGTAFRLNTERGIGSKDIEGLISLCIKIDAHLIAKNIEFELQHFGEFEKDLATKMRNSFPKIKFNGYKNNWISNDVDAYVFLSKYEGFGLAPLEASAKKLVFVNDAFPKELFKCSPNIYPIEKIFEII